MSDSFAQGSMHHARVKLPTPDVEPNHPYRDKKNHDTLLEYLQERLSVGKEGRDAELPRLTRIDKKVAGWIRLSDADLDRAIHSEETGEPLMTHLNLPLTFVQIDDMMTFLAETFSPSRGMFYNTGSPNEVEEAEQITTKMNNDALYTGAYRETLQTLFSALKYNLGGVCVLWGSDTGPTLNASSSGEDRVFDQGVKWQGNRLRSIDRYNTLIDPSVHPTRLHLEGEFGGYAELKSHYWLLSRASRGQFYNCEEVMRSGGGTMNNCVYYRNPPTEAKLTTSDSRGTATDWVSVLAQMPSTRQDGHEIVTFFCRLNPTEFGLVPKKDQTSRSRYELWRFTILDNKWIISAVWQDNVHNHLPMYFGLVHDDSMAVAQKSPAEILIPLQDFGSFLLNSHQEATRSAIYGTTFYDPTMVKLDKIGKGEVAARLPVEPKAYGKDIRTFIWESRANIDTKSNMQDLEAIMGIVNQFFPAQALPMQIASIDRAVTNQVAAVQQGANRRQQKTARLLDDSLFRPMRFAMYYNILQYQPDGEELTDFYTGKQLTLDLASMKDTNLPFIIGQGLKSIDRMSSASMMQQIIFALIQTPETGKRYNIGGMIDYWASMMDVEIDMKQFEIPNQPATPDAPGTDAAGNPVQPATAPESVTEPIYGGQ